MTLYSFYRNLNEILNQNCVDVFRLVQVIYFCLNMFNAFVPRLSSKHFVKENMEQRIQEQTN